MPTLIVKPKSNPIDVPAAELAKLLAIASGKGCDAVMIELAPSPGCEASVIWAAV